MKASIDTIINEFAIRGLEAQDHDLFMRRVANAMNGFCKEALFYGRITKVALKDRNFIPDLWGEARKNIWNESKRNSAKMTEYSLNVTNNGTAVLVSFHFEYTDDEKVRKDSVNLTIEQCSPLIEAFDYEVD